jgi:cell wall-associated NlpC family hydrolase
MSPTRIVSLAVLAVAAVAPLSLFAQTLPPTAPQALTLSVDALIPAFRATSVSNLVRVPLASVAPSAALKADADIAGSMQATVNQALYKAPRKRLAEFAMKLTDIRYRRGGREPSTGFDCSGFTHYVYDKTFGVELPYDAPSQYLGGDKIARGEMKTGDLVFFREGKRITHVGIYLDNGRFIHSPSPGKRVRVDELASAYWAKRFAGARRPHVAS